MGTHYVYVNGLCASRAMGRGRAMAAARDAVAARPDAYVSVQRIRRDASPASTGETVAVLATGDRNPVTGESDAAAAWNVADPTVADVVAFAYVAETVMDAVAETTAAAFRVVSARQTSPVAYETARRVADVVAERVEQRIRDAVADAADGYEPDAVPVVVVPSANHAAAGALQRAGVSHIRARGAAERGAAWYASHDGNRAHGFATIADAVNHAAGRLPAPCRRVAEPSRCFARVGPSPTMETLRADAAAGRPVSLAAVARAVAG